MGHNELMLWFYNRLGVTFAQNNESPNCSIVRIIKFAVNFC
jgi:hypothetical protein